MTQADNSNRNTSNYNDTANSKNNNTADDNDIPMTGTLTQQMIMT